jgi:carboxyl-terminal processing protease
MVGLSGMLTDKSIDLGTSIYKVGSENMVALSKGEKLKGRLVFLVDNQTVSAAEIFSAALQENNRALIVGDKTAGEALPSVSVELPTGAVLLYPIANYKTRNGNFLEGRGVEPNFVVALDRQSLLTGKDAQLGNGFENN